ncbi:response regulator transcription factor [Paenibacillus hexagrammi]|uniref:Response regulator transcription factor n=1 Tax=Paenibacillus hexagrammi TaxID=2908839 RepID=A0ABY3SNU4_9BACL|nr:response regulator transcription factor [Paenibacillus sp. YPD9-1]UJF35723.1 response regulator transcription factor [Paenibacillus sp. YPD9-1]
MRIVIAEDHPLFRSGVRNLLKTTDDLEVIGEAATGEEAMELVDQLQPDLVLMDIRMPGINGIEATRLIMEKHSSVKILILTMFRDDQSVFTAMRAGAKGYVLKDADEDELLQSIRMVGSGGAVFSSDIAGRMMHYFSQSQPVSSEDPALSELTKRELEILACIAEGDSNAQIAERLHISSKTVANYVSNILNKLQVTDRHAAKKFVQRTRELD